MNDTVVVVASEREHPRAARVWGTGAWTPPEGREARDWFTLCRLLGWGAAVATPKEDRFSGAVGWLLVACEPDEVRERLAAAIHARLGRAPGLVVVRPGAPGSPLARLAGCAGSGRRTQGRLLRWSGPGQGVAWRLRDRIAAIGLDGDGEPWLTLDGAAVALARRVGHGTVVTIGIHPSAARDADGAVTAALRTLLTRGFPGPVAWLDMDGVLALRMDDAGGSQNVHLDPFYYPEVGPAGWRDLAAVLRARSARLGVAAVPGWVDDGERTRGELLLRGKRAERSRARIHSSWDVTYRDRRGVVHDYVGEFAALRQLADEGLIDILLHGRTHLHPDLEAWTRSATRHSSADWYREFGVNDDPEGETARQRLEGGSRMLAEFFGEAPTVLVFPGDTWTTPALEQALELDLLMVASYYVAVRDGNRFCWVEQICSPYLDEPDRQWFSAGVPVIGYFHARDVSTMGVAWVRELLDHWSRAGACRMIGLGELAFALSSRIRWGEGPDGPALIVSTPPSPAPHRLNIRVLSRSRETRTRIQVQVNGRSDWVEASPSGVSSRESENVPRPRHTRRP